MASNKIITAEGKTKMLEYVFAGDEGFNYLALGVGGSTNDASNASSTGDKNDFNELSGNNYERVALVKEGNTTADSQSITLSATFTDSNYNPSNGGNVGEIAIVNNATANEELDTFFAFADIPDILKSDNISLKYTIVISIL